MTISQHYQCQGDSVDESDELAAQELGWLEQAARDQADGADYSGVLSGMVVDLVEHNKPLAYIIGNQPFYPLPQSLIVRPPTLIPRPETEHWLAHLSSLVASSLSPACDDRPFRALDIGTGTGCIPLTLAHSLRHSPRPVHALGVDQSPAAVALARENIERCGQDVPGRVTVVQGDLFAANFVARMKAAGGVGGVEEGAGESFDLVVSNPPYIPASDYEGLAASVKEWEDRRALIGEVLFPARADAAAEPAGPRSVTSDSQDSSEDNDGLIFYRKITSILDQLLFADAGRPVEGHPSAPVAAFEVGQGQAGAVQALLASRGYRAEAVDDQWGIQRLVLGYRV